jgi:hypothetical protein
MAIDMQRSQASVLEVCVAILHLKFSINVFGGHGRLMESSSKAKPG